MPRKSIILVVDATPKVATTLSLVLQVSGYQAVAVYDAGAALDMITGVAVDAALVEINLPGLDGVRTAIEIHNRLPNCKVVLMSGDTESTEILEQAKADGIEFPVLAKPIPPKELLATFQTLLTTGELKFKRSKKGEVGQGCRLRRGSDWTIH